MKGGVFGWIGAFLLLAFILSFWKWILAAVLVAGAIWALATFVPPQLEKRRQQQVDRRNGEVARRSGLAARADLQHQQYLAGEDRGLYGDFPPAPLT